MGEFFGALILVLTIMSVVLGRIKQEAAGLAIGTALAVGLTLATVAGAGVLNPAVAWAIGSRGATYFLMPILGGLVGAALAILLSDTSKQA
jgi:glycerol uptake facilitator-like aquaporin